MAPKILAVGSPKGGVGKSAIAVHLALFLARSRKLQTLLVDADPNRSAYVYARSGDDDTMPFDGTTASGEDAEQLSELRRVRDYDVIVVDLPGKKEDEFKALLRPSSTGSTKSRPVPDGLLMPSRPEIQDLHPVEDVLRKGDIPDGLPYRVVFTLVETSSLSLASERKIEFREMGFDVAETVVRRKTAYRDARESRPARTVYDLPGTRPTLAQRRENPRLRIPGARIAESEQRELAKEAAALIGLPVTK